MKEEKLGGVLEAVLEILACGSVVE
jgi:hypothetical protein